MVALEMTLNLPPQKLILSLTFPVIMRELGLITPVCLISLTSVLALLSASLYRRIMEHISCHVTALSDRNDVCVAKGSVTYAW
jgi:hypothetical protein